MNSSNSDIFEDLPEELVRQTSPVHLECRNVVAFVSWCQFHTSTDIVVLQFREAHVEFVGCKYDQLVQSEIHDNQQLTRE